MPRKKPAVTPEEYRKMIEGIELQNIFVQNANISLNRKFVSRELAVTIEDSSSFQNLENKNIEVNHNYKLIAKKPKGGNHIKINCSFCLNFSSEKPFTNNFFEIFSKLNLPINSWPYFREFVQNMTQRMNVPPLTLPLFKESPSKSKSGRR